MSLFTMDTNVPYVQHTIVAIQTCDALHQIRFSKEQCTLTFDIWHNDMMTRHGYNKLKSVE